MPDSPDKTPPGQEPARPGEPLTISSDELFRGARIVAITHAGETYRLLITRNNRLILQK